MDSEAWNERYRAATVWSGRPNAALVTHVPDPPAVGPGSPRPRALDLGCGEGADARWLAARGWQVVGVDWAGVALDHARAAAREPDLQTQFVEGDVTDTQFLAGLSPTGTFDLVTVGFVHPEPEDRAAMFAHLPGLLAPGGLLFVLAHDPEHGRRGLPGPPPHRLLSPQQVVEALDLPDDCSVELGTVHVREAEGAVTAVDSVVLVRRANG